MADDGKGGGAGGEDSTFETLERDFQEVYKIINFTCTLNLAGARNLQLHNSIYICQINYYACRYSLSSWEIRAWKSFAWSTRNSTRL